MDTQTHLKETLNIAIETGKIMLMHGAETYRVEDTIKRMAESRGLTPCNVFVIPTGILVSVDMNDSPYSTLVRIQPLGIDLESIDRANAFAREYSSKTLDNKRALVALESLKNPPKFSKETHYFLGGMAGGFFVLLFGGNFMESIIAYLASVFTLWVWDILTTRKLNFFIKNILGSFAASLFGLVFVIAFLRFDYSVSFDKIIIGPLMSMVPGVSLTNGIRDLISGELLAGSAKIMEALFIAIALAFGVGIVLHMVINWI